MRLTGYNEFSLLSLSCSDYLSLPSVGIQIKNRLKNENVSLSLPSQVRQGWGAWAGIKARWRGRPPSSALASPLQRVDRFDSDIAHIITNSGKKSGLTFAPEAGTQVCVGEGGGATAAAPGASKHAAWRPTLHQQPSAPRVLPQRLRDIINKGLTNEELLRGVKTAWDKGWRQASACSLPHAPPRCCRPSAVRLLLSHTNTVFLPAGEAIFYDRPARRDGRRRDGHRRDDRVAAARVPAGQVAPGGQRHHLQLFAQAPHALPGSCCCLASARLARPPPTPPPPPPPPAVALCQHQRVCAQARPAAQGVFALLPGQGKLHARAHLG